MFENIGQHDVVIELLRQLGQQEMVFMAVHGLVDFGKPVNQIFELFVQAVEESVDGMKLLPKLGFQIEGMIFIGGILVISPGDLALAFPIRPGRIHQLLFNIVAHC